MQPKDEAEFADMLWTMVNHDGPCAIRYPRGIGTGAVPAKKPKLLEIGKSEVLRHGTKAAIFALGNMCELAIPAAEELEKLGISTAVINARWIKPLDTATLEFFAGGCDVICTMEDHVLTNGFGSSVIEHLSDRHITTPVVRIGWPDQFIEHGTVPILRAKHGLTIEATVQKILAALKSSLTTPAKTTTAA
jgi:1-deoxy-D-xylulose-5-phosphate synthase